MAREVFKSASGSDESSHKILVAVDFGTTFSGIAWGQTRQPEEHSIIAVWPDGVSEGSEGSSSEKVPTEIVYTGQSYKWGFQIDAEEERHQWFKLDLDQSQLRNKPAWTEECSPRKALPPGYNPEKLITDYLTALREHTDQYLRWKIPNTALQMTKTEYIITTPAIWSDSAQAKTRSCAERAGMGKGDRLQIISEPEAAATYALHNLNPHDVRKGDTFVLVDAGGGTVDLISYTVLALEPILELEEAAPGTGALCGSTFLNRRFEQYLEQRCENNPAWDGEVSQDALERFETVIKRSFAGRTDKDYAIPVPGLLDDAEQRIKRGKITVPGEEIATIFRPVIQEIVELVKGQIASTQRSIKAVLLVGGFGQSSYLRDSLRTALSRQINVMQPAHGWTAVVRGALMRGLAKSKPSTAVVRVSSRFARKHYGEEIRVKFDERIHEKSGRVWHPFHGYCKIWTMNWYIEKGTLVREDEPFIFSCHRRKLVSEGPPEELHTPIYCFLGTEDDGSPLYRDDRVEKLIELNADLTCVPESSIDRQKGKDGNWWYDCKYEIEVTYYSAATKYDLIYKGVRYDSVKAEFV